MKKNDVKNDMKNILKDDVKNILKDDVKNILKDDVKNILKDDMKNILKDDMKNILKNDMKNILNHNHNIRKSENDKADNALQPKPKKKNGPWVVVVKGQPRKLKLVSTNHKGSGKLFKVVKNEQIKKDPQDEQKKYPTPNDPVNMQPKKEEEMIETESVLGGEQMETESVVDGEQITKKTPQSMANKPTAKPLIKLQTKNVPKTVESEEYSDSEKLKKNPPQGAGKKFANSKAPLKVQQSMGEENLDVESVLSGGEVTETESVVTEEKSLIPAFKHFEKTNKNPRDSSKKLTTTILVKVQSKSDKENFDGESVLSGGEVTETESVFYFFR
ncbi:hypothetical protein PVMG_01409 [Plasmodium vivax Mauritania I]|uniref:Uncharacterized protein n=1 Tax=Plasmodium vivax Mauritania I TaxID=1035515 RepID=A0A0J9VYW9_PLAVI|nr:hypothetical protein PVMG_01409 [Plasmodium vivax Mauritania I]